MYVSTVNHFETFKAGILKNVGNRAVLGHH